ncbi:hypothetical protein ACIGBL_34475 [Streptomyces sp. NPDC085614]|uniref:hypothetical protein n=1 Tax=Streptomyces sp. NPDC085614 TaxID=3365733 RepID=UPI0037D2CFD0
MKRVTIITATRPGGHRSLLTQQAIPLRSSLGHRGALEVRLPVHSTRTDHRQQVGKLKRPLSDLESLRDSMKTFGPQTIPGSANSQFLSNDSRLRQNKSASPTDFEKKPASEKHQFSGVSWPPPGFP